MSKPNKKRYVLSQVRQQYVDAVGGDQVEVELNDGATLTFPHPLFADDEWSEAVDAAESNRDKARAILGDEQYEKFHAAGHADADIALMFLELNRDMQDQVKKRPTRS
ncbi:hypothetical protein ACF1G4_03215 [Streptomyces caelestis]